MPDTRGFMLLVLLGLVTGFLFLGAHGLFEPSEGRYAEVAREMMSTGDYLDPTLDGHPHWTKPPLTYWAAAAGMHVLGRNAWGARFAGGVAFLLTSLAVAVIGWRLWDGRTGLLAGVVYATALMPVLAAAILTTDTLLTLWETLAVAAFVMHWRRDSGGGGRGWIRAMWLALALGFFTKGPPALLPLLPLVIFAAGMRRARDMFDPLGLLLFVLVGFWWYVVVALRNEGLFTYFVRDEVLGRSLSDEFNRNPQWYGPFVVYLPVLLLALGPWLLELVAGVRRAVARRSGESIWGERSGPRRLMLLWFVVPLIVLSLSKSRLPLYVLPLVAPMALLAAFSMRRAPLRRVVGLGSAALVLSLGVRAAMPLVDRGHNAKRIHDQAVRVGGPGARYVLLDEPRLYGVQFYFDGAVERMPLSVDAGHVVSSRDGPVVFITHRRGAEVVEESLARAGIHSRVRSAAGRWYVRAPAGNGGT